MKERKILKGNVSQFPSKYQINFQPSLGNLMPAYERLSIKLIQSWIITSW